MTTGARERHTTHEERKIQHHALLYRNDEEFLAATLPILRASIEANDPTFVVMADEETDMLRDSLGPEAAAVQFMEPTAIYQNTVRAMAAISAITRAQSAQRACVVGAKPGVWSDQPDIAAWARYDAMVNIAFSHADFRAFCGFNTEALPADVIEHVRMTHPKIHEGQGLRDNPYYTDPESLVARMDQRPLSPSPETAASMRIRPDDLRAVRGFVAEQAKRHGMAADGLHNLLVAVTEVATNAVRHGAAPVVLRTWPEHGLVCEITDSGHWQPEELITWKPPESASESGFGLWGAGMLCSTVQVRTGTQGTTVRLRAGV